MNSTIELIVALDEPDYQRALAIVETTAAVVRWYKVGYAAFYSCGERLLAELRRRNLSVFLDLKLHDIPSTVAAGVQSAARFSPSLLSVHASGGRDMLAAAAKTRDEANANGAQMRLLAVTVLTSLSRDDLASIGDEPSPHRIVSMRAELAAEAGIDGVVCAVDEVAIVRARTSERFTIVCPGIRPAGAWPGEQRRTATPAEAVIAGADFIVVGRPITHASDPAAAAQAIVNEMRAISPLGNFRER